MNGGKGKTCSSFVFHGFCVEITVSQVHVRVPQECRFAVGRSSENYREASVRVSAIRTDKEQNVKIIQHLSRGLASFDVAENMQFVFVVDTYKYDIHPAIPVVLGTDSIRF